MIITVIVSYLADSVFFPLEQRSCVACSFAHGLAWFGIDGLPTDDRTATTTAARATPN